MSAFGGKADNSSAVEFHTLHVGAIARASRAIVVGSAGASGSISRTLGQVANKFRAVLKGASGK